MVNGLMVKGSYHRRLGTIASRAWLMVQGSYPLRGTICCAVLILALLGTIGGAVPIGLKDLRSLRV